MGVISIVKVSKAMSQHKIRQGGSTDEERKRILEIRKKIADWDQQPVRLEENREPSEEKV